MLRRQGLQGTYKTLRLRRRLWLELYQDVFVSTQRCETVKLLLNGKFQIVPFSRFAAIVKYICYPGFELVGQKERVCQGDGYWSGRAPICRPLVSNVQNMAAYEEGTCSKPPAIKHATHDASPALKSFPLGTQLTYSCLNGFKSEGGYRALCVGQGRWVGLSMTCQPKQCGHPGDPANSIRDGNIFTYPHKVSYTCLEGYTRIGRYQILCQADGRWSNVPPICKPKTCRELSPPTNGLITGMDFTYGATIRYNCLKGFVIRGPSVRKCQSSGYWSDETPECVLVNCGSPGPIYNGYYISRPDTSYGANVTFFCYNHTNFDGASNVATCLGNGSWSHPAPNCWVKCFIPQIENGTLDNATKHLHYMKHGQSFNFTCQSGFLNEFPSDPPTCKNGTWSRKTFCKPAPCNGRPPELKNGLVRYHSFEHGSKAQCICNLGFKIIGEPFLTCHYGKWVGRMPKCDEVFCKFPGNVSNGQLLLVGDIGKYDYPPYATKVKHNQQIEYQCDKGYGQVGNKAATCVDGQWSPPMRPKCELRKHPPLPTTSKKFY
ncbi:hypothetical protein HELRODRAFT_174963 [Helobdella robusta]|uniref:Sushi domain-containing protein n=1 Tax=Helobdella robusta TaxID=6412 RepID=T1F8N5_HELRO|nr:hypothetical protein HELRODRAFT_174963 [Helobdella robusta]ESO01405.1 hypothetical protein HELRODRAFT_174963 [Helobdella robusta]